MTNTRLYRYQRKGVYGIRRFHGRCLLADEMGLGKSIQALSFVYEQRALPLVIVCPASIKWNWERECKIHFGLQAQVLDGRKPPRINRRLAAPDVVVINYDILSYWTKWLMSLDPESLIFDEAHYCGNYKTKRSRAIKHLSQRITNVIGLTGTPLVNRPKELWPVLNIIRPDLFPYFRPFAEKYCAPTLTPWGWQYNGATNLQRLHQVLRDRLMVRRLKKNVFKQLPKNRRITIPIALHDHDQYVSAQTDFLTWLRKEKGIGAAERGKKAEELSKWNHLLQLAAELKLPFLLEWIDNFLQESESKLVVFGIHKKVLGPIFKRFEKQAVLIDGNVKSKERQRRVDVVQRDPKVRLCVGNIKAAGEGLNLTTPDTVLFAELPWTPTAVDQAIARVNRIGQTVDTTTYFVVAKDTIESRLCRLIQEKQRIFDSSIEGKAPSGIGNVYNQLLEDIQDEGFARVSA